MSWRAAEDYREEQSHRQTETTTLNIQALTLKHEGGGQAGRGARKMILYRNKLHILVRVSKNILNEEASWSVAFLNCD